MSALVALYPATDLIPEDVLLVSTDKEYLEIAIICPPETRPKLAVWSASAPVTRGHTGRRSCRHGVLRLEEEITDLAAVYDWWWGVADHPEVGLMELIL